MATPEQLDEVIAEYLSVHRLTNIDEQTRTAICSICGPVLIISKGFNYTQKGRIRVWGCRIYNQQKCAKTNEDRKYRKTKNTDTCERCGFKVEHESQLDLHHKDGNHENNNPDNLQVLCSNCHRYVTWVLGER